MKVLRMEDGRVYDGEPYTAEEMDRHFGVIALQSDGFSWHTIQMVEQLKAELSTLRTEHEQLKAERDELLQQAVRVDVEHYNEIRAFKIECEERERQLAAFIMASTQDPLLLKLWATGSMEEIADRLLSAYQQRRQQQEGSGTE